jgi:hypothetical protein
MQYDTITNLRGQETKITVPPSPPVKSAVGAHIHGSRVEFPKEGSSLDTTAMSFPVQIFRIMKVRIIANFDWIPTRPPSKRKNSFDHCTCVNKVSSPYTHMALCNRSTTFQLKIKTGKGVVGRDSIAGPLAGSVISILLPRTPSAEQKSQKRI